jgi:hypothetical protein
MVPHTQMGMSGREPSTCEYRLVLFYCKTPCLRWRRPTNSIIVHRRMSAAIRIRHNLGRTAPSKDGFRVVPCICEALCQDICCQSPSVKLLIHFVGIHKVDYQGRLPDRRCRAYEGILPGRLRLAQSCAVKQGALWLLGPFMEQHKGFRGQYRVPRP